MSAFDYNYPIINMTLQTARIEKDDVGRFSMVNKLAIATSKNVNDILIDKIIKIAKENGFTDILILNEDFIVTALQNEIERRKVNG